MKRLVTSTFQRFGLDIAKYRNNKITKPINEFYPDSARNGEIQASVDEVKSVALVDRLSWLTFAGSAA